MICLGEIRSALPPLEMCYIEASKGQVQDGLSASSGLDEPVPQTLFKQINDSVPVSPQR